MINCLKIIRREAVNLKTASFFVFNELANITLLYSAYW